MVKIVVLCDGTWCGQATGSCTNVELTFRAFTGQAAGDQDGVVYLPRGATAPEVVVKFFDGIGLEKNESFFDYLFNGATGNSIDDRCKDVYSFIVNHFQDPSKDEIWMFGLSRGAYTVRCVAGMIHNCGIVRKAGNKSRLSHLVNEVYFMYRSRDPKDHPNDAQAHRARPFRERFSYQHVQGRPPIKFMGLFDTVGALGIPNFYAGKALEYAELNDQVVSSDVQHVFQALSTDDTLSLFEPCFIRRKEGFEERNNHPGITYSCEEKWFPGCHYDVGRQTFYFARERKSMLTSAVDHALQAIQLLPSGPFAALHYLRKSIPEDLPKFIVDQAWKLIADRWETRMHQAVKHLNVGVIHPTPEYSDAVLTWMLEKVHEVDPTILKTENPSKPVHHTGSGCVYPKMLKIVEDIVPFAGPLLNQLVLRDRRMPLDTRPDQIHRPSPAPISAFGYQSKSYEIYTSLAN